MSERGIEANPEKIMAISNMGPICNAKGVQRLTGCLAALSRFISRLKACLTSAPILVAPKRGEPLLLYITASNHGVSAALVVEREEPGHQLKVQRPIYFIGEVLTDPKVRNP